MTRILYYCYNCYPTNSGNLIKMTKILKGLLVLLYDGDIRIKYSEPEKGIRFITTSYQLIQLITRNRYFSHNWLIISSTWMLDAVDYKSLGKPGSWVVSSTTYLHSSFSSPEPGPTQWVPTLSPSVEWQGDDIQNKGSWLVFPTRLFDIHTINIAILLPYLFPIIETLYSVILLSLSQSSKKMYNSAICWLFTNSLRNFFFHTFTRLNSATVGYYHDSRHYIKQHCMRKSLPRTVVKLSNKTSYLSDTHTLQTMSNYKFL
jgi:hypothetical protein